jgi:hypothetical protein
VSLETIELGAHNESLPGEALFRHTGHLLGGSVSVTYALDDAEHQRRLHRGLGAVTSEFILAALLTAPLEDMARLPEQFQRLLDGPLADDRLVTMWRDLDEKVWMRRAISPPVRPVSATLSAGRWRDALTRAHRWNGYAERTVLVDENAILPTLAPTEANHYGFGLVVNGVNEARVVVPPRAYSPRRFTAARWLLAEQVYEQFRQLTAATL